MESSSRISSHSTSNNLSRTIVGTVDDEELGRGSEITKMPLFQKPLTPSDVGKLNRLVIPKQHAEKHFPPLNGGGGSTGEKGLLLSFEDEAGKCWRFRYSYWNSSQSYVLTKGWSRFVKEKKLDAGDAVLFLRHRSDGDRMFISWRRKGGAAQAHGGGGGSWRSPDLLYYHQPQSGSFANSSNTSDYYNNTLAGSVAAATSQSTRPVNNNSKRLRLFGVNLEYQPPTGEDDRWSEPSTPVGSPMSTSRGQAVVVHHHDHQQQYHQYFNHYTNKYYTVRN